MEAWDLLWNVGYGQTFCVRRLKDHINTRILQTNVVSEITPRLGPLNLGPSNQNPGSSCFCGLPAPAYMKPRNRSPSMIEDEQRDLGSVSLSHGFATEKPRFSISAARTWVL